MMPTSPPFSKMKKEYKGERPAKTDVVEMESAVTIKSNEILVESLIEAQLTYTGRESGKQYVWKKAGDKQLVLSEDVPELIAKRLGGTTCCGNDPKGNKIFQIVSGG